LTRERSDSQLGVTEPLSGSRLRGRPTEATVL
jgi:hypothetical protein